MADFIALPDEALDSVAGGATRFVEMYSNALATIRTGPSLSSGKAGFVRNGAQVNTTGEVSENPREGITWYKIDFPVRGWIDGHFLNRY